MKRIAAIVLLGVCVGLFSSPVAATTLDVEALNKGQGGQPTCSIDCTPGDCQVTLFAGQFIDVGEVSVVSDGTTVHVTYEITDLGWSITEVHFYAGDEPPAKSAPGRFPYKWEYLNTQLFEFDIPLADVDDDGDGCLHFAAHAVVREVTGFESPDLDGFADALPGQVSMVVSFPGTGFGDPSYFDVTISGGTVLDGTYEDWCVDVDHFITPGTQYTADVYSSYEDLPQGLVDHPENFDLVNWVINQDFVGQPSGCNGVYTYGDVQRAIWELIDDNPNGGGLGPWTQCRLDEIVAAAQANGEGFVPGCFDVVAVVLNPVNGEQVTIAQVTFAEVQVPCDPILGDGEETAWGGGPCPFKQGWGSYFRCGGLD